MSTVLSIVDVLNNARARYLQELDARFVQYDVNATGYTLQFIKDSSGVSGSKMHIIGPAHIDNLIMGTPPGTLVDINDIKAWVAAKSLDINAYAIRNSIFKYGSRLWRNADPRFTKPSQLLVEPVQPVVEQTRKELITNMGLTITSRLKAGFK